MLIEYVRMFARVYLYSLCYLAFHDLSGDDLILVFLLLLHHFVVIIFMGVELNLL